MATTFAQKNRLTLRHSEWGIPSHPDGMPRALGRDPETSGLLRFDGYAVLIEVEFYAAGFLLLLVEQVPGHHSSDGERADYEVENIAIHRLVP